jgi:hippurate hydrolase
MLKEGLYKNFPRPDYALALHTNATIAAGKVGYTEGPVMANVDAVDITVNGVGGHGALPHTTKDPIVLASQIVLALQTIVSRQTSPFDPCVVTVGSIHGGTQFNIIPDKVELKLTLRSYSQKAGTPLPSLHSSIFAPLPEPAIRAGIQTMSAAVMDLLKK